MTKKIFTPQEAAKRLPLVKKIVTDILANAQMIKQLMNNHQGKKIPFDVAALEEEVQGLMRELEELGCYYKDWNFEIGLVDFPSVINGREVMLCWRSDEKNIRWYHGYEDGFAGRKLIPENLLD